MQSVVCNYCQSSETHLVNRGADLQLGRAGDYQLVRCCRCGLIYQNPRLTIEELPQHYPDQYLSYPTDLDHDQAMLERADRRNGMKRRCVRVEQYASQKGTVLDIGCATGEFLDAMRERGWATVGVELSEYAAAYAREQLNLDVRTGTLTSADFPTSSFDVVTMWDVLEHVVDPKETLKEIVRILKPNGLFVAMTPNPASAEAKLFGRHWAGWDRPRHLHVFPPTVLKNYLYDAGFERVVIKSFSGRLSVTLLSVRYWLTARGIGVDAAEKFLSYLYNYPLRLLTLPAYWIAEHFNQTTGMTAFARLGDKT